MTSSKKSPRISARKKSTPSLVEAVELHVQELKAPWPPGLLIERLDKNDPNPYYKLKLEPHPTQDTRRSSFGGDDFNYKRKPEPQPVYWVVLDSFWDPDHCYLWIEIMAMGEKRERGWVRDPESKLRKADLTST